MLWIAGQLWQERPAGSPSERPQHAGTPHSLEKNTKYATVFKMSWVYRNAVQDMNDSQQHWFISVTAFWSFRVEDVAAPLCQVRQHAENSLNTELRKARSRFLTASTPSSVPFCQHRQHLLCYLEFTMILYEYLKNKFFLLLGVIPHLLLLC